MLYKDKNSILVNKALSDRNSLQQSTDSTTSMMHGMDLTRRNQTGSTYYICNFYLGRLRRASVVAQPQTHPSMLTYWPDRGASSRI
jgi:hypothetical protein